MTITFGSLFAGIGGFDLGFERAGMVCKWQVEIDKYAQKVLAKHWPDVRRHDDIKTFPPTKPEEWQVDVICGGFPCQDISYAGKGAGLAGERSRLFYEAIRVVCEVGPRIVVLENVAGLLTRGIDQVLGTLASIGFDAEWHCIPAAAVGAPHIRDRVFILAYANSERLRMQGRTENAGQARGVQKEAQKRERIRANFRPNGEFGNVANTNSKRLEKRKGKDSAGARPVCWPKPGRVSGWPAEPAVGRVANGVSNRAHRLRGLGNAVVPQVAEYVGQMITNAFCTQTKKAAQ